MVPIRVLQVVACYPTAARPHSQVFVKTQVDSLVAAGVTCEVLNLRGHGPLKYATGPPQVRARLRAARFDLIHAHYAYCGFVCLHQGLPLVTSLLGSDLAGFVRRDGTYSALSRCTHRALARHVAARSAACIVKSNRMRQVLGLDAYVVPNGVDLGRFHPLPPAERAELRVALGLAPRDALRPLRG